MIRLTRETVDAIREQVIKHPHVLIDQILTVTDLNNHTVTAKITSVSSQPVGYRDENNNPSITIILRDDHTVRISSSDGTIILSHSNPRH